MNVKKIDCTKVLWSELFPEEFKFRLNECPIVYFPLGLCEPHGQISAFGLDTYKAEFICDATARIGGGIVAPTMEYHIHEVGPSAKFLEERVGENNPHMTAVPSFIFFHFFLYQLRSFYNAGFRGVIVLSGHGGAHPQDLRKIANFFMKYVDIHILIYTDFDLVQEKYPGDHAGKYEISTLMYIRPDLVDFSKRWLEKIDGFGGKLALGDNAEEASKEYGEQIINECINTLYQIVSELKNKIKTNVNNAMITITEVENIWTEILQSSEDWITLHPRVSQQPVSAESRWKPYEFTKLQY